MSAANPRYKDDEPKPRGERGKKMKERHKPKRGRYTVDFSRDPSELTDYQYTTT